LILIPKASTIKRSRPTGLYSVEGESLAFGGLNTGRECIFSGGNILSWEMELVKQGISAARASAHWTAGG
jgi:hypothetical protein